MSRWIFLALSAFSPSLFALNPEVLECTVGFTLKPGSEVKVNAVKDSIQNARLIHSTEAPGHRWLHLVRFTGPSVSQFSSEIKFESDERKPAQFHLLAQSGRSFGEVQLFNLEFRATDSEATLSHSAKAELVSVPSPQELNSYASLTGNLGFQKSDVTDFEIHCGTVGWNFGGL